MRKSAKQPINRLSGAPYNQVFAFRETRAAKQVPVRATLFSKDLFS